MKIEEENDRSTSVLKERCTKDEILDEDILRRMQEDQCSYGEAYRTIMKELEE